MNEPFDRQSLARAILVDDPGRVEGLDEQTARPVAARAFGGVDLDRAVVDLEAGQGRHDVLDQLDHGRAVLNGGSALRRDHLADLGRDRGAVGQIGPDEPDAGVGFGREKPQRHVGAVEESDSANLRRAGDGSLRTLGDEHSFPGPFARRGRVASWRGPARDG